MTPAWLTAGVVTTKFLVKQVDTHGTFLDNNYVSTDRNPEREVLISERKLS